jgi:long-chain fatty acid transport protein
MSVKLKNFVPRCSRIRKYVWALAVLGVVATAVGEGFRNATIGTFGLGQSGGRIADVDDPSAVQQNPANLAGVTNAQAQFTPSVIYINANYQSPLGPSATTIHPWKELPDLFLAMPLKSDRYALGLGITVPYGLANQWQSSATAFSQVQPYGNLTYSAPNYSQLITINCNPTLSVKLTDQLSIGAGLDVMWSDLEFKQFLSPQVPNLFADAEGEGVGVGGNAGLTWRFTQRQRLALTYRSAMRVDYSGETKFENAPANLPNANFGSQITFPNIVSAGYGVDLTDKIHLESDVEWLDFSEFQNLPINIGANALKVPSQNLPEKWHNTFTAGLGGNWQFAEHWVVRGGYQYFESPVPDSTFSPTIPDANQNVITIGIGWHGKHNALEASYGLDFYNDRHITNDQNPAYNGTYTFNVHLFSLSYIYTF